MDGEIIKYALTQGAFAALFVWLLIDTRKDRGDIKIQLKKINP